MIAYQGLRSAIFSRDMRFCDEATTMALSPASGYEYCYFQKSPAFINCGHSIKWTVGIRYISIP